MLRPRLSLRLIAVGAAAVALAAAGESAAHFDTEKYSFKSGGTCGGSYDYSDPIGFVFYGAYAAWDTSRSHIWHHTDWDTGLGGDQLFSDHGRCENFDAQTASAPPPLARFHIRLNQLADRDRKGRLVTVGTPHHEDSGCHAVDRGDYDERTSQGPTSQGSGFDQGRRDLQDSFTGTHHQFGDWSDWGNTWSIKQCDDEWAGSNDVLSWWKIDQP